MTLRLTDEQDQILDAVAEHLQLSRQQAAIRALEYFNEAVIRGNVDGWWAYWFLDPTDKGGVTGMLEYIFGIAALMIGLGFVLSLFARALRRIQITSV